MPTYRVTISQFQRVLAKLAPDLERAMIKGLRSGALFLERTAKLEIRQTQPYAPIDKGELINSVDTSFVPDGAIVSVDAPHAAIMEFGTRPFTPPLAPLLEWVKRKGLHASVIRVAGRRQHGPLRSGEARVVQRIRRIRAAGRASRAAGVALGSRRVVQSVVDAAAMPIARAIQVAISKRGIAPRHYFANAVKRAEPMIRAEVNRELAKLGVGNVRSGSGGGSLGETG